MAALPQQVLTDAETDFDMDRAVTDPNYRRRIIGRLRRDWRVAETKRQELAPDDAALADSEAADSEDD
jgi:hypothetical protein